MQNGHYMGLNYGFDYEDGKYRIAECVHRRMDELIDEERAMQRLMEIHDQYFQGRLLENERARRAWWDSTLIEYGLVGRNFTYRGGWLIPVSTENSGGAVACMFCGLTYKPGQEAIDHRLACEKDPFALALKVLNTGK